MHKLIIESGVVINYGKAQGLNNQVIYSIQEDQSGLLWVSTNKGISSFDPQTELFRNYGTRDGLQREEYNRRAGFTSPHTGHIYFGGMNGLNVFDPAEMPVDSTMPTLQ